MSLVREKGREFAILLSKKCLEIQIKHKEFEYTKQLKRSSSSIAANLNEAQFAQSRKDFIHKLSISLKEANESLLWLDILTNLSYLEDQQYHKRCNQIIRLLVSSLKTLKKNKNP